MLTNFSFLIDNEIAGCAHPDSYGNCSEALSEMRNYHIGAIVSLDEQGIPLYLLAEHGMNHIHIPVTDFRAPSQKQAEQFIEFVNAQREDGRAVLVHCRGGYGRTGTMLACYLVSKGRSPEDAIDEVRTRRPGSIETREQEEFIMEFARIHKPKPFNAERRKKP